MNFKKTTFPNGLRVITIPTKGNPAVMVLVVVETGSNYESKAENGLSHFLEHMCFKGTKKRGEEGDIPRELDSLGAQNNAFTSNEFTGYYAKASKKHFSKLFDIISDLYLNPTLPEKDIEKESGVVLEELSMFEDMPERIVWGVLAKLMYGDVPAGRELVGTRANIKRFKRHNFVDYRNKHYVASSTIVIVAGDVTESAVIKEVRNNFKEISHAKKSTKPKVIEKQLAPRLLVKKKKTNQNHMVMAFRAFGAKDKRFPALIVLSEILGRGMSSRLFSKLRDEMGVCYYVKAEQNQATDHGAFTISVGANVSRTKEVVRVLLDECSKLTETLVSEKELEKVKEHHVGNLYMNLETTDAIAEFYAGQEVIFKKLKTPQELEAEIRKVTVRDILNVAKDIFRNDRLNLAIVGDVSNEKEIKKTLFFK